MGGGEDRGGWREKNPASVLSPSGRRPNDATCRTEWGKIRKSGSLCKKKSGGAKRKALKAAALSSRER